MTAVYRTIVTPAAFATEMSLTGLFILGTNEASSIYNHATASSGTVTGTPTYGAGFVTFAPGTYIDTGVVDPATEPVTVAVVMRQALTLSLACCAFSGTTPKTGIAVGSGFKPNARFSGTGSNESFVTPSQLGSSRAQGRDYFFLGSYDVPNVRGRCYDPYYDDEFTDAMEGGGARVSTGANFMIGAYNSTGTYAFDSTLSMVMLADYTMTEDQEVRCFEWASQYLHQSLIYL